MKNTEPTNILPYIHAEDDAAAAAAAAAEAAKKKVAFDDDQKARINEIFKERYGEVQEKHRQEMEAREKQMKEEFEAKLAEAISKKGGKEGEGEGDNAEFKRILEDHKKQTETERAARVKLESDLKQRDADMLALRKEQAIRNACQGLNLWKLDQVLSLTTGAIEWDKGAGAFIVRNDDGDVVQGDDLKPIALSDYYAKWAEENPWFVKSDARGGAGSTGGGSTTAVGEFASIKTKADLAKDMPLRIKFIEKYGLAKYEALPLK